MTWARLSPRCPAAPQPSGNARADSLARVAYEKQLTQFFETRQSGFHQRTQVTAEPTASSGVQPHTEDLEILKATQADALKRFNGNAQVNQIIDEAYRTLHSGGRLDREALTAAFAKATETNETRAHAAAVNELSAALDADGNVSHDRIPARLTHGYFLPRGLYEPEQTIALLATAKELGLTQDQVTRYVEMQGADDA